MRSVHPLDVMTIQETAEERSYDFVPQTLDDYLGQAELKQKLSIYAQAAKMRGEPLDHLLFFGPPGLGKTTLAQIMASLMGVSIKLCSGPMMERTGDLVAILSNLEARDILFIDEIHRMSATVEEVLYTAMEQFRVDIIIGQGAGAKSVSIPINPFTLVGATTKTGMLSAPLRSRFGIIERLDFYSEDELAAIVRQTALFLQVPLSASAAQLIAKRARGTPRIAKKILRRVRDFAQVTNNNQAEDEVVAQALSFLGIDDEGLTELDVRYLKTLVEQFNGGPVGLETLAAVLAEDSDTLEDMVEPYLLRKGFIEKMARGRHISPKKAAYFKQRFLGQKTLV
jgi:Holliday junction DNA helicase RuvB